MMMMILYLLWEWVGVTSLKLNGAPGVILQSPEAFVGRKEPTDFSASEEFIIVEKK